MITAPTRSVEGCTAVAGRLQPGFRADAAAASSIRSQISQLDAQIAKAEAALYAVRKSKSLSRFAEMERTFLEQSNQDGVEKTSGYDIMGTESEPDDIASLSLRFLSNRDDLYKNLESVPPLDGYEDIACHADPYEFGFTDPDTGENIQSVGVKFLANRIRERGKYRGGPIRLIACESGKLDNGLAQQFANEMGVPVLAPTKTVFTNSQGFMVLADEIFEAKKLLREATEKWNPKGWIVFEPKEG